MMCSDNSVDIQTAKTECPRCKKPLLAEDEILVVDGAKHHAHHFTCVTCHKQLKPDYKTHQAQLYCPEDYQRAIAPLCYVCRKPVFGRVITAMGKSFHTEHFVCSKCE